MPDTATTARSLAWTTIESGGLAIVSFLTLVVLSRYLTPREFGITAMSLSVIQMLNIPVELLANEALVQRERITAQQTNSAFTLSLALGIGLSVGCWLGADAFGAMVGEPEAGIVLAWMSLSLPATGMGATIAAIQRRTMRFDVLAARTLIGRLVAGLAAMSAAIAGLGLWSLVIQHVLMAIAWSVILWIVCADRPRPGFSPASMRDSWRFGLSIVSVTALAFSLQRTFMLLVGTTLGSTAAGYLNLAFRTIDMLRDVVGRAVLQVSLPLFSRLQSDRGALERVYVNAVEFTAAISFPLFLGLLACTPQLVGSVYGAQWAPSAPYFAALAALTLVYFTRLYSLNVVTAVDKPHYSLPATMLSLAVILVGMLIVGRYSLPAAACVWAVATLVPVPLDIAMLRRASGIAAHRQFTGVTRVLAICVAMVLAIRAVLPALPAHWTPAAQLVPMVLVGAFVYMTLLWATNRQLARRLVAFGRAAIARRRTA